MIQNIRVDMIYYRTASDFEMEFNLGGCCRMRMFTDKTDTRKGLVDMLARAVSRSRVIIACGPLFTETGLIQTVAVAVGKTLAAVNNQEYSIQSDDRIEIIKGALPLVTPEGFFGGCIIESGPQTIILLTENKSIRKSIMKNLIHPYISDISYNASHTEGSVSAKPVQEELVEEEPIEESEVIVDEIEIPVEEEIEEIIEEEIIEKKVTEEKKPNIKINFNEEDYAPTVDPTERIAKKSPFFEAQEEEKGPIRKSPINAFIIVLIVMLVLVIGVIAYLLVFIPLKDGIDLRTYIYSLFNMKT